MEINIARLNTIITEYSSFALYGCGEIAKETFGALLKLNKEPVFCLVTDKSNSESVFQDRIPIYSIAEKEEQIRKEDILLILAVNERNKSEIQVLLQNYNITEYISIAECERNSLPYIEYFENLSEENRIKEIASSYIDVCQNYNISVKEETLKIKRCIEKGEYDSQKIVFVIGALTPRVIKVARALIDLNYKIEVYFGPRATLQEICISELNNLGIECNKCRSYEELIYYLLTSRGKAIHLFTNRGHSYFDKMIIGFKNLLSPIVYDEYDIIGAFYTNEPQEIIDNEKYCLENAAGICNRGFEIEYLREKHNYDIQGSFIQLHDCCNDIQYNNAGISEDELSLCYVGQVLDQRKWPEFAEGFRELADRCKINKCHFHVYPHRWDTKEHVFYMDIEGNNEYFHFHKPVSHEQLCKEISLYDYGVWPLMRKVLKQKTFVYNTKEKHIYAATNKFFDYLDAGLPIIAPAPRKLLQCLEPMGLLLEWAVDEYDFDELRRRKKGLKENVILEREKLKMSNQIHKLVDLYESVSK